MTNGTIQAVVVGILAVAFLGTIMVLAHLVAAEGVENATCTHTTQEVRDQQWELRQLRIEVLRREALNMQATDRGPC
jgi:hypothetical protein